MKVNFDYARYKQAALAAKAQRNTSLFSNQSKPADEPIGRLFPWVLGYDQDVRLDPDQLLRASELGLIYRVLWQLVNTIVYKRDIKIKPPEDQDPKPLADKALKIKRQIKRLDGLYQVKTLMKQNWIDTIVMGSGLNELGIPYDPENMAASLDELIESGLPWPKINGWKAPTFAEYRDATSFTIWPPGIAPISHRWIAGRVLKGIVYDAEKHNMQYWQSPHNFVTPIQIPTCRIMHVKDQASRYPDGDSYLAGVMPAVAQQEYTRKVMMLALKRWGAGQVGVKVGLLKDKDGRPVIAADPEGKGRSRQTVANQWADDIIKNWDNANAFKLLEEHELIYPPVRIGGDLSKPDEYFKKEILQHLVPRDFIEQNNGALSASSDPLIDFFLLVVNAWRPIVSKPWELLFGKVLELNGFEGWTMEYVYQTPDFRDTNRKHANSLAAFQAHAITLDRFYEETDRPHLTDTEREQLYEEIQIFSRQPTPMPMPEENGLRANKKADDPVLKQLQKTSGIATEVLKEFYPELFDEKSEAQE